MGDLARLSCCPERELDGKGVHGLRSRPEASPLTLLLTTGQLRSAGKGRSWWETCEWPQSGGGGELLPTMPRPRLPSPPEREGLGPRALSAVALTLTASPTGEARGSRAEGREGESQAWFPQVGMGGQASL